MKLKTKQNRDFVGNMFQKCGWFYILKFELGKQLLERKYIYLI